MRDEKEQISIFDALAKREGISPDEVRAKIFARIQEGLHDPDPDKRAAWERIPHAGEIPTPEEYVAVFDGKITISCGSFPLFLFVRLYVVVWGCILAPLIFIDSDTSAADVRGPRPLIFQPRSARTRYPYKRK